MYIAPIVPLRATFCILIFAEQKFKLTHFWYIIHLHNFELYSPFFNQQLTNHLRFYSGALD